jgi:hypothetical protein
VEPAEAMNGMSTGVVCICLFLDWEIMRGAAIIAKK